MRNKIIIIFSFSLLVLSCKKEIKSSEVFTDSTTTVDLDSHNSENALDWQGIYKGVLPCADCEGIETTVTLNKDKTFSLATKYLGKGEGKVFIEKGSFTWDKTGTSVTLEGSRDRPSQYKVGENTLTQLDMQGNPITGQSANLYILKKK
ncbi:copper resistance protein NlpE [Flavobacterium sp. N3904]|uniref:copper resistance protein NlpE n=1 Tax=Flavobacterium sp. N3904 TaxID=2986835 RepID=UPI00222584D2|nr:copper resistance protein NlpE [Flavobacterium sp. N3904]